MALKIVWSPLALQKRKIILSYWIKRNSSTAYSRKLNTLFVQATNQLSKFPKIGRLSDVEGVRIKIVRDYLLFYEITGASLIIDLSQH